MDTNTDTLTDKWLDRVAALLAKAESTDFPEEAEALIAKAQSIMAAHAIDEAMLAAAGKGSTEEVTSEIVWSEAPYAGAKDLLWAAIASANNCKLISHSTSGPRSRNTIVGFPSDIAAVKTLYGALSIHAASELARTPVPSHDRPKRFRFAFLLAFAGRIGERLEEAKAQAFDDFTETSGTVASDAVGVELASRADQVARQVGELFPRLRTRSVGASSSAGYGAGTNAANRAGLGQTGVGGGGRRALGS